MQTEAYYFIVRFIFAIAAAVSFSIILTAQAGDLLPLNDAFTSSDTHYVCYEA